MLLSDLLADRDRLRNRLTVPVLMSTDVAEACVQAQEAVDLAAGDLELAQAVEDGRMSTPKTQAAHARLEQAQAQLDAAHEAAEDHLVDFVVESIGSDAWEELVSEHPPTDEQREKYGPKTVFNPRTFPEAAMAVCLVEPEVTGLGDIRKLRSQIPDVVWQQLFEAVLRVNRGANRVPLSLTGSVATRSSAAGSEPPTSNGRP